MKLLACLLALSGALVPWRAEASPTIQAVDALAKTVVGKDTPGLAILVMRDGDVLHMKGYGFADLDDETPVDEDTIFDLASMSKNETALAARLLIEDGLLEEDTPVSDILPDFDGQDERYRPITVGDLIHHVAGLPDYLNDDGFDYEDDMDNAAVVSWLAGQPLVRAPGTKFDYSNSGYVTLASVVAAADGKSSLRDVLRNRVWGPLGMTSTNIASLAKDIPESQMVTGYKGSNGKFEENMEPTVVQGDGSVFTNLSDLALYEKALATNELLDEDATASLFTNGTFDNGQPIDDGEGSGYGYGWSISIWNGNSYASHSGSWMGTATYFQRNLTTGLTVIVLANGEDLDTESLGSQIEAAVVKAGE
ncbi:serine hydrolase domain-containing protein [Oryzibacter oryziterrae]|uniref:serine hydrolase domain-containing protein n=1 Tax=Oryzibacter oryziterrae TaxID=2766474 RepID=UPI001F46D4E7|nr:serine hydrolase domain-containing protein [Oryzibacter oryziterrae]